MRAGTGRTINAAIDRARQVFGKPPQVLICVFGVANDPRYNIFKAIGLSKGIVTQAMQSRLLGKTRDLQAHINVAMKLNKKLGGDNFHHKGGTTNGDVPGKRAAGWPETHACMFFGEQHLTATELERLNELQCTGFDLTHAPGKPSIAAAVASMDDYFMECADEVRVQPLLEPSLNSPDARPKKNEIIEDLKSMVLVSPRGGNSAYREAHPPRFKSRICFSVEYGCPEDALHPPESSSFAMAFPTASSQRCSLEKSLPFGKRSKLSKSTTRAGLARHENFVKPPSQSQHSLISGPPAHLPDLNDRNDVVLNAPAGTVVDHPNLVDPRNIEWYGASHAADLGTTRMVKYNVMVDDNNLSLDDLQSIANTQGHAFQRCNLAISGPAYVRYADIICSKAKGWMSVIDSEDGGSSFGGESVDGTVESRAHDLERYQAVVQGMATGLEKFRSTGCSWWI
ncbi:hypothetical protein P7C70_g2507, partial [Phenoliferia sp. Uapishka_3]